MDSFSTPAFNAVTSRDPSLLDRFDGFTQYVDVVSPYVTTWPTIPALLSGIEYDNSESLIGYTQRMLEGPSLLNHLSKNNYQVDVVTLPRFCPYIGKNCYPTNNIASKNMSEVADSELLQLLDLTLFRMLPQPVKKFVYNGEKWLLQRHFDRIKNPKELYNALNFPNILKHEARVTTDKPVFKMIHLMIPHVPLLFDGNCNEFGPDTLDKSFTTTEAFKYKYEHQATCSLKVAASVVEVIKKLGIYSNTMLIISADHGFPLRYLKYKSTGKIRLPWLEYGWPLLMVKPLNAKNNAFIRNDKGVSLIDLPATISEGVELAHVFPGINILKDSDTNPSRRHRSYTWRPKFKLRDSMPTMREWAITGPISNSESWRYVQSLPPYWKVPKLHAFAK